MASETKLHEMADDELVARLRALVETSNVTEAELVEHLGELDERRLYLPRWTSLWELCLRELGFSENVASLRIAVARESRRFPEMLEMLRAGRIHLSGLRLLCGQLTAENCHELLAEAAGKSKREIEELLARRSPSPAVPDAIRKTPSPRMPEQSPKTAALLCASTSPEIVPAPAERPRPAVLAPLSAETFRVQFTASRALRDKIREAQDLLRHQLPTGDLATIVERALTLLIAEVKKTRWAVGHKPRSTKLPEGPARSRAVPDAIKRAVYERDGGRCSYVDPQGRRCAQRGWLELDHADGFARTHEHRVDRIFLRCRSHNQHAADQTYGRAWMQRKRQAGRAQRSRGKIAETTRDGPDRLERSAAGAGRRAGHAGPKSPAPARSGAASRGGARPRASAAPCAVACQATPIARSFRSLLRSGSTTAS